MSKPTTAEPPRASLSPHKEVSPVIFSHPDQHTSVAESVLVLCGGSECDAMDKSVSLAASDVKLPRLINSNFPADPEKMSISGHSMGGHGALICALKNPGKYKSVSAFAPICNPIQCAWGQKAFSGYLGPDKSTWELYDATVLAESYSGPELDILIDQGLSML
ncbi:S-formylglutathione hydrolase-like [Carassius carassius]|uniref:S-formylglutathione hydrolase-like n=1 Tax=Carassius carassius TaxID=217509 RepID=UPI002868E5E1|nr:S-formylglutathione hydrolase-like [Carassius carassius]